MKMKDLVSEEEAKKLFDSNTECSLCAVHEQANRQIASEILCPHCGYPQEDIYAIEGHDYTVVGESNEYNAEHDIRKLPVFDCPKCNNYFALFPEKIIYNANHDVYYTGGRRYLNDDDENKIFLMAQQKIKASLEQWVKRYYNGEKLDPKYPALWIKRDITSAIAEYLYEKGFKK